MSKRIAIAVVEHEDRFLIGPRPAGVHLAGMWEFPGGKIEPNESPAAAAVRECREETGLAVEVIQPYLIEREDYGTVAVELHFFACRLTAAEETAPQEPFCWVKRQDLAHYEFPSGNRRLLALLAR